MLFKHCYEGLTTQHIGAQGLSLEQLDLLLEDSKPAYEHYKQQYEQGSESWLRLPLLYEDLNIFEEIALRFQDEFSDVVLLGTGGSSLGAQTFCNLYSRTSPKIHFMDNIDPQTFHEKLNELVPQSTGFLVISKSGSTAETLMQFLTVIEYWRSHYSEETLQHHFCIISEDKPSPLHRLADHWHIPFLPHPHDLGGRFSAFSLVGLLPVAIVGGKPEKIRSGAKHILEQTFEQGSFEEKQALLGAALITGLSLTQQKNTTIFMPYTDRLQSLAYWHRQLWAESLGKEGKGIIPVPAKGAVDQHSQLQLYLQGPKDKSYSLLHVKEFETGLPKVTLPFTQEDSIQYLSGHSLEDLFQAEFLPKNRDEIQHHL